MYVCRCVCLYLGPGGLLRAQIFRPRLYESTGSSGGMKPGGVIPHKSPYMRDPSPYLPSSGARFRIIGFGVLALARKLQILGAEWTCEPTMPSLYSSLLVTCILITGC